MKFSIQLFALLLFGFGLQAQVISISPLSSYPNQTFTATITLAPTIMQAGNPPAAATDVYLEQNGNRIYTNAFSSTQVYPGFAPYTDSLSTDFTIPLNAILGWYDVHVITYDLLNNPIDNVLANGFLVPAVGSCPVPFNIIADLNTGSSEIIRWDPSLTADTFRVRYRLSGTTNYFYKDVNGSTGDDSTIITNLGAGISYDVDVSTICLGISSTYSIPVVTFTTLATPLNCVIPFGIAVGTLTNTTAAISWSNLVTADTFRIRYYELGTSNNKYVNINGLSPHLATLINLNPATTYVMQISSVCLGVGNGYSPALQFTTASGPVACALPFGLSATGITNSSATINWTPNVTADTFRIRYSVNGTTNYLYFNSPGLSGNSATITGLLANVTYQYQVSSVCLGVGSGYSVSNTFTTTNSPVLCGIPYGLTSSPINNASATVSWTNMVSADSFLIRYSVNGTTNYFWKKIVGTLNSTTLTGLTPVTTYQWQVRSLCSGAPSSYSPSNTFNTPVKLANPNLQTDIEAIIFPNPATEKTDLIFSAKEKGTAIIRIVDISGRIVWNKKFQTSEGKNNFEIGVNRFANGNYIVELTAEDLVSHLKLVVSH